MRNLRTRRANMAGAIALACAALAACGGGGDPLDVALNFALEGTFADIDGLTMEFSGDEAVVVDFGGSVLGTNPSVMPVGSALIDDISCGESSCTGQVAVPNVVNGTLQSVSREEATITQSGQTVTVSSATWGQRQFNVATSDGGGDGGGSGVGGATTLTKSATCPQWWASLKAVGTWKFTRVYDWGEERALTGSETMTFSGTNQWSISSPDDFGFAPPYGTVICDENFAGSGYCRIYLHTPDFSVQPLFAKSLANGHLVFKLSYDEASTAVWELSAN